MVSRRGGTWFGGVALYLIFAGQLTAEEIFTAGVVATAAALWAWRIQVHAPVRFTVARDHAAPWLRGFVRLAPATLRTGAVLLRALGSGTHPGHARRWAFERGGEADPAARGRRASAVLLASLAPDSVVLRADPGGATVLVHVLGAGDVPPDSRWLA